jgi:hypothetical protein
MRANSPRRRLGFLLGIGALAALLAAGAAYALTASSFKYSSPKTGYVRVSHLAFAPDGGGEAYSNDWHVGLSGAVGACLNAGVDLPGGSQVKSITFYYKSGPASEFLGFLTRIRVATAEISDIATISPVNDDGTPTSVTVNVAATDQPVRAAFAYGVRVCPGSDGTFLGARIKYTYTSAGS